MRKFISIVLLFASCTNNAQQKESDIDSVKEKNEFKKLDSQISTIKYRPCISLDSLFIDETDSARKGILINAFPADFEGVAPSSIDSIRKIKTINIDRFGLCHVYEIRLSNALPAVISKKMYFLYCKTIQKGIILQLENLYSLKMREVDSAILPGGVYMVRGKGYFFIYRFDGKDGFKLIFDSSSDDYCNNGIAVYNSSLDCVSYNPFKLNFKNIDLNGDGLNDLCFTGKALFFCAGLETGYGRKDRKPLKVQPLKIVFETVQGSDSLYWKLASTNACKVLN